MSLKMASITKPVLNNIVEKNQMKNIQLNTKCPDAGNT